MAKSLASKLRTGAMVGLAALAVMAPGKAKGATILDYVTTTVSSNGVDQDLSRPGIQRRISWKVQNAGVQDYTYDAIWEFRIPENLAERNMYGFTNGPSGSAWSTGIIDGSQYWLANLSSNILIRPGFTKTFSALIDETNFVGTTDVPCYGISWNGPTEPTNRLGEVILAGVPLLPFPQKIYLDSDAMKLTWYSPTNSVSNLNDKFVVYKSTNLLNSVWGTNNLTGWKPVQTNIHSTTTNKYEYLIPTNEKKAFYGIRKEKVN